MLYQVRIPLARKLATGLLLCSGVFILIIACIRTATGISSYKAKPPRNLQLREVSFAWGMRENVSIFIHSPPSLLPPAVKGFLFPPYRIGRDGIDDKVGLM